MVINSPQALLLYELRLAENAEEQLRDIMPSLLSATPNARLQHLLKQRLCEGERVLSDIRGCLELHSEEEGQVHNEPITALVQDTRRMIAAAATSEVKQLAATSAARRLQHLCLAGWANLHLLAIRLDDEAAAEQLASALEEGQRWDRQFGDLALQAKDPAGGGQ